MSLPYAPTAGLSCHKAALLLAVSTLLVGGEALAAETNIVLAEGAASSGEGAEPIIVTGTRIGYDAKATSTATKTDTPLEDVPQSVSVITGQQIDDQALRSVSDVLRYVPGAVAAQ